VLTGSLPALDTRVVEWLKPDGLAIVTVGTAPAMHVEAVRRTDNQYSREALFETVIRPLEHVSVSDGFRF
jgi:protein-L-isoaspartate O-methyltransferase